MLDPTIWFQISGKFRTAARLPSGMTGIKALQAQKIREPEWAENMGEGHAGDHYLRCCAPDEDVLTLTRESWEEFKKAGGTTYMSYAYDQSQDRIKRLVERMVREEIVVPIKAIEAYDILMRAIS